MHISLAAEPLFKILGLNITNTILSSFVIVFLIIIFSIWVKKNLNYDKPKNIQLILEMVIDGLYSMISDLLDENKAKKFFSFLFTFFIFILFSNWFGLTPLTQSLAVVHIAESNEGPEIKANFNSKFNVIAKEVVKESQESVENSKTLVSENGKDKGFLGCIFSKHCYITRYGMIESEESTHILRAPTTDLSMAMTLALISVVSINFLGFYYLRRAYVKKYIDFSSPVNAFVGILEIVSELGKLVSFSFRLFGNIFAGEILLLVITSITFGLVTLPFLLLELFVGVIQAFVFFMLTAVFIGLAVSHESH